MVADFNLVGVDWITLLRQATAHGSTDGRRFIFIADTPVGEEARVALREVGAWLLCKPFTRDQFLDALTEAVS